MIKILGGTIGTGAGANILGVVDTNIIVANYAYSIDTSFAK